MRLTFKPMLPSRLVVRRSIKLLAASLLVGAIALCALVAFIWQVFPVPMQTLAEWPASPVVTDRDGHTIARLVGRDEQWRLPVPAADMSDWLLQATIAAEDARFSAHCGIDPLAVLRAVQQNITRGRVVSGASTLSMQVCRMLDDRPRTLFSKLVDGVRAIQLERQCSKHEIIEDYLNIAPYGGNIRGVEAASLLYFGKHARDLSLGEATLLAGIPQQPNRLRPDLHLTRCLQRRDYVLQRMTDLGFISASDAEHARKLPLDVRRQFNPTPPPVASFALQRRPHGGQLAIDTALQTLAEQAVIERRKRLPSGADVSVVVIDIASGELRALVGSADASDPIDGQINGFAARRSPGSALKPFLYAAAFETQRLGPDSIVADDPQQFADWTPENFDREFAGRLTAGEALRASRNIPAIHMAQTIGLDRCTGLMEACGLSLPPNATQRGGLTLAVGGIEVTLLELTNAYATLGRRGEYLPTTLFLNEPGSPQNERSARAISPAVCAAVNDILSSRRRVPSGIDPATGRSWFMWKTGTSSGRRDAWAVGHNHRFAIGVWVGKFSGAGHHDFVGKDAAEPLLAKLFQESIVRNDRDPAPLESWVITNPLPVPDVTSSPLAVTSPQIGEVFIAVAGQSVIHPRVNRDIASGHWFLNNRFLGTSRPERLELAVGSYELRCVTSTGQVLATMFRVE